MANRPGRPEPPCERLEAPVGLVNRGGPEAPPPESGEELRHCGGVEHREIIANLRPELLNPGPVGAERRLSTAADVLVKQERLAKVGERASFGGERLLFCDVRSARIVRNAFIY